MNPLIKKDFTAGMRAGIPVCVGYFSVSFGFGAMAVSMGLNIFQAVLISATNLTSAGQFAGLTVIATGGAIIQGFGSALCFLAIGTMLDKVHFKLL